MLCCSKITSANLWESVNKVILIIWMRVEATGGEGWEEGAQGEGDKWTVMEGCGKHGGGVIWQHISDELWTYTSEWYAVLYVSVTSVKMNAIKKKYNMNKISLLCMLIILENYQIMFCCHTGYITDYLQKETHLFLTWVIWFKTVFLTFI